jgi:hypothetical protein
MSWQLSHDWFISMVKTFAKQSDENVYKSSLFSLLSFPLFSDSLESLSPQDTERRTTSESSWVQFCSF